LSHSGQAVEFIQEQYRHCKPILVLDAASTLLDAARIRSAGAPSHAQDPALLIYEREQLDEALDAFARALERHRSFERETDPPRI
jgi:catalase